MTHTIGILAWDGFLTSEVTAPIEVLGAARAAGHLPDTDLLVVAPDGTTVSSHEGLRVGVDTTIEACPRLQVLIVPGSADMSPALDAPRVVEFVARQAGASDTVASHCAGAFLLASAGVLDQRRVTTYPGGHADLRRAAPTAHVEEADVVRDGNLISSSGGVVSYRASLDLLEILTDEPTTAAIAADLQLGWFRTAAAAT